MPLTPWASASLFLSLYPATGMVKGISAQSLLLVGEPGSGKSELLRRFSRLPSTVVAGDITVDPLRELAASDTRPVPLRHIIMPEFGRLFSHRDSTVAAVTNLLTSLMTADAGQELVGPRGGGHRLDLTGKQIGVLAAMPTDVFKLRFNDLVATGFLSRFIILGIRRSKEEKDRVLRNIANRSFIDLAPFACPLPTAQAEVSGGERYGDRILKWVRSWNPNPSERLVQHVVSLLPAVTLLRGRHTVSEEDFAVLKMFQPYLTSVRAEGAFQIQEMPALPSYREFTLQRRKR